MSAIEADQLVYSYGAVKAVDGVSLKVDRGKVFGLIGPNGAGKTTTVKVLTGLIQPSSGSVKILGMSPDSKHARSHVGVVQQGESYDRSLTVESSLRLYGYLWGVPKYSMGERLEFVLRQFGLKELRSRRVRELSMGERRRLQVAREFLHGMEVLFLDEPTIGLDPVIRREVLDFFKGQVGDGLTIFFTTHNMSEAEYLCDEIAVMSRGRIVVVDAPSAIRQKFGRSRTVELVADVRTIDKVREMVTKLVAGDELSVHGDVLSIRTDRPMDLLKEIVAESERNGYRLNSISIKEPSLEDVLIQLMA